MATFFFMQGQNIELIVEGGKPMGGAVVATQVWMQALHELGHTIVLFRNEDDNRKIRPEFDWIKPCKVYHSNKGIPMLRYLYYRFPKLLKALRTIKPDFVIESIPAWSAPFHAILCRIAGSKQVIRIANDNMLDDRIKLTHSTFEQIFISLGFRYCDYIMTQNTYQSQRLKMKYPRQKVIQLINPTVLDKALLIPKNSSKGYIAWVANFRYQKNLKLLFEIAKLLQNEKFLVAGAPMYPLDQETASYLPKLEALPNVQLVGTIPRDEIMDFFKGAKFLLNTSRYEGFSNTFLEAMCTGTPILSTNNVNPDGIISNFNLGYIYDNPPSLQRLLKGLDNSKYLEFSKNCLDYVAENHDHLALGKKLLHFLGDHS
ncbi:glycosyltransferase family 4 protein [Mariniradius sediminis]|uniref:Glycosyltransferase n=1 Tax=Mariniradius sediminis TaxID=2909237 RepID=A0ABS9BPZ3_9BACT|nr:glycosyltransferase [Mariniradius sediminis]MCF1750123.1 glycosyltransferase [Mariniradius sediminis]